MKQLKDVQLKIVGNDASHGWAIGTMVRICNTSNTVRVRDVSGTEYNVYLRDIELVSSDEETEPEDPNQIKIRNLRAQALILSRVDCSKLDESKVARLVKFYIELRAQNFKAAPAMKSVKALALIIA